MDDDIKYLNELGFHYELSDGISDGIEDYYLGSLKIYCPVKGFWVIKVASNALSCRTINCGCLRKGLPKLFGQLKTKWINEAQDIVEDIMKLPKIGE